MIRTLRHCSVLAGVTLLAACSSESMLLPTPSNAALSKVPVTGLLATATGVLTLVTGAQRTSPLPSSITVTQAIGINGGTLSLPQAGVTITVPVGALTATTLISMTARGGSVIAYDFAPHGTTFAKPVVFTQALAGTNVSPLLMPLIQLGYYADPTDLTTLGGSVTEFISGSVNLVNGSFTSSIMHFSGYMISCGNSE